MPPRTKRNAFKEESQMRTFVKESCTFTEPIATSSPNVNKDKTQAPGLSVFNTISLQHSLKTFCDKAIRAEQSNKEAVQDHLNKRYELFLMKIGADLSQQLFYSCTENLSDMKEKVTKKNKRLREEDFLMPPPTVIRKSTRKTSKKPRNDSEVAKSSKSSDVRTRSSTRLFTRSNNVDHVEEEEQPQLEDQFTEFKTPAPRGGLRRNRHNIATVTPGPNIDAPQTILRRPNPGETAISLCGSPLLVSSEQTSTLPQITIPLKDGKVMAVLAKDGLNPTDFPTMDSQTLSRLKMLHEFLGKLYQ